MSHIIFKKKTKNFRSETGTVFLKKNHEERKETNKERKEMKNCSADVLYVTSRSFMLEFIETCLFSPKS